MDGGLRGVTYVPGVRGEGGAEARGLSQAMPFIPWVLEFFHPKHEPELQYKAQKPPPALRRF